MMASASNKASKRKREEYQMQLLNFHSRIVYRNIKSIINQEIIKKCTQLYKSIDKKYQPEKKEKQLLQNNIKDLIKTYNNASQPYLLTIKNCINKIINIPPHLLLVKDEIQRLQFTDQQFNDSRKRLKNLQDRIKQMMMMNAALKREKKMIYLFKNNLEKGELLIDIVNNCSTNTLPKTNTNQITEKFKDFEKEINQDKLYSTKRIQFKSRLKFAPKFYQINAN